MVGRIDTVPARMELRVQGENTDCNQIVVQKPGSYNSARPVLQEEVNEAEKACQGGKS